MRNLCKRCLHNCPGITSWRCWTSCRPETRRWYAAKAIEHNWSRNILVMQIETRLLERSGKAVTNFEAQLPKPQSDLARESLKDPYRFDFLGLTDEAQERDIENALVKHVTEFLLELGAGFAFVGRQVLLDVGGDEFFIDLLFYHLKLRCYVVIELKAASSSPSTWANWVFISPPWMPRSNTRKTAPPSACCCARAKTRWWPNTRCATSPADGRGRIQAARILASRTANQPAQHRAD